MPAPPPSSPADPATATREDEAQRERLAVDGFVVIPGAVATEAVDTTLRLLNLAIRRHGLTAEEIAACQQTTFFPHLRWEPEVWTVLPASAAELLCLEPGDEWAEPQLLLRFPDEDQPWPLQPHVDEPPPWAGGRSYRGIVGVALTAARSGDGAPLVSPGSHLGGTAALVAVPLEAGDALVMHPALAHSGSLNLGARVRAAVYFRLLAGRGTEAASSSMSMTSPSMEG